MLLFGVEDSIVIIAAISVTMGTKLINWFRGAFICTSNRFTAERSVFGVSEI
jgi:hypothetical protein